VSASAPSRLSKTKPEQTYLFQLCSAIHKNPVSEPILMLATSSVPVVNKVYKQTVLSRGSFAVQKRLPVVLARMTGQGGRRRWDY
jgi:hypothetical protein